MFLFSLPCSVRCQEICLPNKIIRRISVLDGYEGCVCVYVLTCKHPAHQAKVCMLTLTFVREVLRICIAGNHRIQVSSRTVFKVYVAVGGLISNSIEFISIDSICVHICTIYTRLHC
jgi:hypothetical protein